MVFFLYAVALAIFANAYGAVLPAPYSPAPYSQAPAYYAHPSPPPVVVHHAPPPPSPVVYNAAPHQPAQFVPIISQSYDAHPDGSYVFQYQSADGSAREEQGFSRVAPGSDGAGGVAVQGRFVYNSPEGPVEVSYIADENGYQPSGASIHPEILKAVAAQVAFARAEGPTAYHAAPAPQIKVYSPVPPSPIPQVTYSPYQNSFKAKRNV